MARTRLASVPVSRWSVADFDRATSDDIASRPLREFGQASPAVRQRMLDRLYGPTSETGAEVSPSPAGATEAEVTQWARDIWVAEIMGAEDLPPAYRVHLADQIGAIFDDDDPNL
ncbi:MAG: hypothetical protein L6R43_04515 [Planctomycetes bacterium]|nr:hypothetical protein [Planctomycetota bacterium]